MSGDGSIYQRADGKWVAQLSQGTRADRTYKRRVRDTKKEAAAALRELKTEADAWSQPSKRSLGDYLRRWLDESVKGNVTPSTYRTYANAIEHFRPIHHLALSEVRADAIEAVCNRMRAVRYMGAVRAPLDLGPASPKTVRNAQMMLRTALEQAHQRGHVRRNEAKLVRLARVPVVRRPAMTPAIARDVLKAIEGDRYEAAYALCLSGMRAGEVLGLAREDVDLETGTVHLWRQLRGSGRNAKHAELKTAGSEGYVDLPAFALTRLRAHIERHDPVALLFVTPAGYAVNGTWFTKHFQALLRAAGVERMNVHDLRAGAATLLAGAGVHPRAAQELLRHANVTTTLRHYTRTTDEQRRSTAEALDRSVTEGVTGE